MGKPKATVKHISSKNADYGAAEQYLTFEHDEFNMKPVRDETGRMVPREGYRIDTVNCGDEDFAISCLRANLALFEAAGRYFKERGLTKFPVIAKIQAETESLISRENAVYSEYRGQKTKIAELRRVKSNIDAMLKQEHRSQRRKEQER